MSDLTPVIQAILKYPPFLTEVIVPSEGVKDFLSNEFKKFNTIIPRITSILALRSHPECLRDFPWANQGDSLNWICSFYKNTLSHHAAFVIQERLNNLVCDFDASYEPLKDLIQTDVPLLKGYHDFLASQNINLSHPWDIFFEYIKKKNRFIVYVGNTDHHVPLLKCIQDDLQNYEKGALINLAGTHSAACQKISFHTNKEQIDGVCRIVQYNLCRSPEQSIGLVALTPLSQKMLIKKMQSLNINVSVMDGYPLQESVSGRLLVLILHYLEKPSFVLEMEILRHPLMQNQFLELVQSYEMAKRQDKEMGITLPFLEHDNSTRLSASDFIKCIADYQQKLEWIWAGKDGLLVSAFLDEVKTHFEELHMTPVEWASFLKKIFKKKTCHTHFLDSSNPVHVFLINTQDALHMSFDTLIMCDLSEDGWIGSYPYCLWINEEKRQEMGLFTEKRFYDTKKNHFASIMKRHKNIFLTKRAHETPVRYDQFYTSFSLIDEEVIKEPSITSKPPHVKGVQIETRDLPHKLSPSSLRMLAQNPIGFYVQYVWKIAPLSVMSAHMSKKQMGILVHALLQKIVEQPTSKEQEDDLIQKSVKRWPSYDGQFFCLHMRYVVDFVKEEREKQEHTKNKVRSYFEWESTAKFNEYVSFYARFDCVQHCTDAVYIIDYKTGAIPSQKSIDMGQEPQMLVLSYLATNHFQKESRCMYWSVGQYKDFEVKEVSVVQAKQILGHLIDPYYAQKYCFFENTHITGDSFSHIKRI